MTHRHGSRVSRSDGLPRRIDFDDGSHIDYAYSADGEKLRVDYYLNPYTPAVPDGEFGIACDSSLLVHTGREYAGNRVYDNGVLSRLLFDGGRLKPPFQIMKVQETIIMETHMKRKAQLLRIKRKN